MGFYYISIFSLGLLGIVYGVLVLVFWGVARLMRNMPGRKMVLAVVGVVFLILPVAEELWIAWNFGQACREAGTFIYKKVEVEGFYDDTTGWGPRQLAETRFQFVESKDVLYKKLSRVEKADTASRDRALAWYAEKNQGKVHPKDLYIVHPVSDSEQIVVSPSGVDAWRVKKIDSPSAKYHYLWSSPYGVPVSHKVGKSERVVIDAESSEPIARYVAFGRRPPWFWIGLGVEPYACDAPGRWPLARDNLLIYRDVLIPMTQQ